MRIPFQTRLFTLFAVVAVLAAYIGIYVNLITQLSKQVPHKRAYVIAGFGVPISSALLFLTIIVLDIRSALRRGRTYKLSSMYPLYMSASTAYHLVTVVFNVVFGVLLERWAKKYDEDERQDVIDDPQQELSYEEAVYKFQRTNFANGFTMRWALAGFFMQLIVAVIQMLFVLK
jgi:hypothetical protein